MKKPPIFKSGYLLVTILIFGAVFFLITTSFFSFVVTQRDVVDQRVVLQRALEVAEAGINYYRWYLAHYPGDVTNGTGASGPYTHVFYDPEGAAIGEFSLSISSNAFCGDVASVEVTSVGYLYDNPEIVRTITAQYSRPSVAEYSYIINSNVWAGPDRQILGPYHSNGGIRMDGQNYSTVSSGQSTWLCNPSFGCTPTTTRSGVFTTTANANTSLFSFPSPPINFNSITVNLAQMRSKAQTGGGIFLPPSGQQGYRITFNSNGTISVRRVTSTTQYWGNPTGALTDWAQERNVIANTSGATVYTIPDACPLIFVQDKVWLEGAVSKKVTIAAADELSSSINPSIILNNNITYTSASSSGLLAIAEQDVLLGLVVPNDMTINGIFIAQNGRFGRNYYCQPLSGLSLADLTCTRILPLPIVNFLLPVDLQTYNRRNSLTINGTIVSNGREGTKWTRAGVHTSGFDDRTNTYDRNLVLYPPPLIPRTSDVSSVVNWRDER